MTRLLTVNLQHGLRSDGSATTASELASAFDGIAADVVAMQEVDRGQPRSGGIDQAQAVADALGLAHVRMATTIAGDLREQRPHGRGPVRTVGRGDGAGYGIAIASRWPVLAWFVRPLTRFPIRYPGPGRSGVRLRDDEPRALLAAVLATPAGELSVGCTHLSLIAPVAAWQLRVAVASMATLPTPTVLAGDLNLGGSAVRFLSRGWRHVRARTFPATQPDRQLDHVLLRGVRLVRSEARRLPISDHRALAVDALP